MLTVSTSCPENTSPLMRAVVTAVELLALAALAFLLAKALWFIAYGAYAEPFDFAEPDDRPAIRDTRLHATPQSFEGLFSGRAGPEVLADIDALPETRLQLRLFGVRTGADPETGTAIVEAGANGQRTYAVGQEITGEAVLAAVYADRIVIRRGGVREVLFLREEAERTALTPPSSGAVVYPDTLITDLSLQPYFESGNLIGFRVNAADTAPALSALGLERGDIILEINGRPLPQDAEAAARLFPQLRQTTSLQLTVRREGERVTLDVSR